MTRRIALAILISVWSMLLIAAVAAYFSVRSIMISDLDSLLYARVVGLPELVHAEAVDPSKTPLYDWADSYTITPDSSRPAGVATKPVLLSGKFSKAGNGNEQRTVEVAATSHGKNRELTPVRVSYSGSTARLNSMLHRIRLSLFGFVALATGIAAAVAIIASRIVLRPLKSTANLIGTIDEQTLGERIPVNGMPSEFVPVVEGLNQLLARLERAFANQKRFVASASHELRTPVAALATTLELAERRHREPESLNQTLGQCRSQVHVLRLLVERLMEYVSTDTISEEPVQDVDVAELMNQCLDAAEAIGTSRQIQVVRSGPKPLFCRVPPGRLRSVVMNLLGNAVEHNRDGGRVEMTWIHDGEKLCARIADNGPGIAPEHVPDLFAPFNRAGKSRTGAGGHLGLGLFIVQSHLKAMNGHCTVDSKLNEGTAFSIEVRCQKLQAPQQLESSVAVNA